MKVDWMRKKLERRKNRGRENNDESSGSCRTLEAYRDEMYKSSITAANKMYKFFI